ncbi:MAG: dihydropteroate synthase [Pedobacter sp.]|nr:MAG: dihydropteroate synthase [Pedobacter sp.]
MISQKVKLHQKQVLNDVGRLLDFSSPQVMGILNVTPDSFYDGGRYHTINRALKQCARMLQEGAAVIDLGAYSSRPGARFISEEEEIKRILPLLKVIKKEFPNAVISIDTFRALVAELSVQEGAQMINDISAGELDSTMFATVARLKVSYILMHMKGNPQTMCEYAQYGEDILVELYSYFVRKIEQLRKLGVVDLIIDPGFGFAKTLEQNYELLNRLDALNELNLPMLVGVSRKTMIYKLLGITPTEALNGTTVIHTMALLKGANLLRVHDVKPAVEAVRIFNQLK